MQQMCDHYLFCVYVAKSLTYQIHTKIYTYRICQHNLLVWWILQLPFKKDLVVNSQELIVVQLKAISHNAVYRDHSSNSHTTTDVKRNSSPDLSPSSGPVALVTIATSRASNQPADGDVAVKNEVDQRTEGEDEE